MPIPRRTEIAQWTWNHLLFVREGETVRVYLNGHSEPEIETKCPVTFPPGYDHLFFGGHCDSQSNWEGRLDEIAVFRRVAAVSEFRAQ